MYSQRYDPQKAWQGQRAPQRSQRSALPGPLCERKAETGLDKERKSNKSFDHVRRRSGRVCASLSGCFAACRLFSSRCRLWTPTPLVQRLAGNCTQHHTLRVAQKLPPAEAALFSPQWVAASGTTAPTMYMHRSAFVPSGVDTSIRLGMQDYCTVLH